MGLCPGAAPPRRPPAAAEGDSPAAALSCIAA